LKVYRYRNNLLIIHVFESKYENCDAIFWYNTITNTINTNILYILHENYKTLQEARRLAIVKEAKISLAARRIQAEWRMHVEYKKFWTIKSATDLIRVKFFIRCILRLRYLKLECTIRESAKRAVRFVADCIRISTTSFSRLRMWARLQHKLRWLPHSRALGRAKVEMVGNKTKTKHSI
jgi:hypothetical protein